MLPLSSNVNSSSSGSSNLSSSSINKNKNVKSNNCIKTTSTTLSAISVPPPSVSHCRDNTNVAVSQHLKKDKQKIFQYLKPQTHLLQEQEADESTQHQPCLIQKRHHLLVYCDDHLISGSLDALIAHMVPTCDYYPENTFIFSFLLSARLFIRPHELLSTISETWEQQQTSSDVVDDAKVSKSFIVSAFASSASPLAHPTYKASVAGVAELDTQRQQQHALSTQISAHNCIRLLAEWIETFPYDFRDERLMQQVRLLARKCVYIDNSLGKQVSRILQLLVQRLTVLEKYEEFLQSLAQTECLLSTAESQQKFTGSMQTTSTAVSNPIAWSAATTYNTDSRHTNKSSATISASGNANHLLQSSESHLYLNSHSHQYQHLPQSESLTNSVNLPLHNLSGHFSNNSASLVNNDIQGIMDICPSSAQLAHQLTAIELERLSHIGPEEFVQAFAKEYKHTFANHATSNTESTEVNSGVGAAAVMNSSLGDIKKTRNLESYVQWFNHLSYLTATEIVKYPKKKQRVRIIEFWIETARECFNIGNFNSLMAIIAGLNLSPISRLKKTWSKVPTAKFSVLEHQMDPTSNFNSYRSTLKAAMWRCEGATNERERIIIPFFSLFVKDLYFLNEGCSNRLPNNNHINFEKCAQLSKQVMEFNEWKKVACPFEKLPNVIMFLQSSAVLNENTLSIASFECEPPENTQEKGRYKTLKSETKHQLQQQQLHEQ